MTHDTSRCDMYKEQSENVKPRSYCKVPQTLLTKLVQENRNDYRIPITEDECKVGSPSLPEVYHSVAMRKKKFSILTSGNKHFLLLCYEKHHSRSNV